MDRHHDSADGASLYLTLNVVSSRSRASASVNGATVLNDTEETSGRGIHVLVLNQSSGAVMARRLFDTYLPREDEALSSFLNLITDGRFVLLTVKDEGSANLKQPARELLRRFGSKEVQRLNWRDAWVFVFRKISTLSGVPLCEHVNKNPHFSSWAEKLFVACSLPLEIPARGFTCLRDHTEENNRRREFCNHVEGYPGVCDCNRPEPISFKPSHISNNVIQEVPVAVIASNRPLYLYRSLRSLLAVPGSNANMITVFMDGFFEEPMHVVRLFGLRVVQHKPIGVGNVRVSQHYKFALSSLFKQFPGANFAIILEEDLDVAPDFFSYFNQLAHLLDEDPSLYCISAWNDHGYMHSTANPSRLYRVETMPGLGWMLKRDLFTKELEPNWPTPDKTWDWDMWMRTSRIRRARECVIPDVSRTYHFGASGLHVNSRFQELHFRQRALCNIHSVQLDGVNDLKETAYEHVIETAIANAIVLDHSVSPCQESFIPDLKGKTYVLYIKMLNSKDITTWLQIAKCFKIWDLDARGSHKGLWRFHLKANPILVVGVPFSPYSKFKPVNVEPIVPVLLGKIKSPQL